MMIVDDESLFRKHMKERIDWESLGFVMCCEANNGIVALQEAEKYQPDLALIDISMPYMDGLDLAGQLKRLYPHLFIIIVTGHNEFEYARKAMRIGVMDYLLKPFDNEEFTMALQKARSFILGAREDTEWSKDYVPLLRESFLNQLIRHDMDMDRPAIEASLLRFRMPIPPQRFRVVVTEIDNMYENWSDPKEIVLWKHTVSNMLQDLVKIDGEHYVFHDAEGHIVSILAFRNEWEMKSYDGHAFERLGRLVERHFKFTVTVGFGTPRSEYQYLHDSYREALLCIQLKLTAGQGRLIWFDRLNNQSERFSFFPAELHESLIFQLRAKDWNGVEKRLEDAFSYMNNDGATLENAYTIMIGLISVCLSYAIESGHAIEEVFGAGFSPVRDMRKLASIQEGKDWITEIYRKAVMASEGIRSSKSYKLYHAAQTYIQESFADPDMTVEGVAAQLFIDSSYLRKIFKREGGTSVLDYITYVRMQKAKELIGAGYVKLLGIAEQVGYNDPNYFSKCFKKQFGLTPTEYETRLNK
ncbi:response regulator [Cohnella yongneupensis]|uniref:Response regulator n=1 Tax=Cohnella yongneupensis TaxID=425006 RepID=A0ABW0QX66_9BACL